MWDWRCGLSAARDCRTLQLRGVCLQTTAGSLLLTTAASNCWCRHRADLRLCWCRHRADLCPASEWVEIGVDLCSSNPDLPVAAMVQITAQRADLLLSRLSRWPGISRAVMPRPVGFAPSSLVLHPLQRLSRSAAKSCGPPFENTKQIVA